MMIAPLRHWLAYRAVSPHELARLAGVNPLTVYKLAGGRSRGYVRTWRKLARALEIRPEQIREYRLRTGLDSGALDALSPPA